ncbi:hypothetical protein [Nocardia sp. NPDC051981]|uniref:hypothetical protein n=1 Tax=Nocardia sp. NPDC051981 TaxID=3155417 RepID=UPI0034455692
MPTIGYQRLPVGFGDQSARMAAAEHIDEPIRTRLVSVPVPPSGGFTAEDLFELLPEGGYAPTGRVKVDRPFPIDIELPEVTW